MIVFFYEKVRLKRGVWPVSYTHLDVYKRQDEQSAREEQKKQQHEQTMGGL